MLKTAGEYSKELGDGAVKPALLAESEPDVFLDIPTVKVDEISLTVEDLQAHVSVKADVLDLVHLSVGVDVTLGKVELEIKGVEAQAILKARLHHVYAIIARTMETIDNNPEMLPALVEAAGDVVEKASTVVESAGTVVESAEGVVDELGETTESITGQLGKTTKSLVSGKGHALKKAGRTAKHLKKSLTSSIQPVAKKMKGSAKKMRSTAGKKSSSGSRRAKQHVAARVSKGARSKGKAKGK